MEEDFGLASFHEFGFAVVRVLPVAQAEALAAVADAMVRPHSPTTPHSDARGPDAAPDFIDACCPNAAPAAGPPH